jgi:hypothetical protein
VPSTSPCAGNRAHNDMDHHFSGYMPTATSLPPAGADSQELEAIGCARKGLLSPIPRYRRKWVCVSRWPQWLPKAQVGLGPRPWAAIIIFPPLRTH